MTKKLWCAAAMALLAGMAPVLAQGWDKKTTEKMLKDGAKKMESPTTAERETGADWMLGYLQCPYKTQYLPVVVKALKDPSPKVRKMAAQSIEKLQAAEAIPDLLPLLDDPVDEVAERTAYALGGLGAAAKSAEPALKKAAAARKAQKKSTLSMTMDEAINEIEGKSDGKRYSCDGK